jgi:hypothetical protein
MIVGAAALVMWWGLGVFARKVFKKKSAQDKQEATAAAQRKAVVKIIDGWEGASCYVRQPSSGSAPPPRKSGGAERPYFSIPAHWYPVSLLDLA